MTQLNGLWWLPEEKVEEEEGDREKKTSIYYNLQV